MHLQWAWRNYRQRDVIITRNVTELHCVTELQREWWNYKHRVTELHKTWRNYAAWGIYGDVAELQTQRDGITWYVTELLSMTELRTQRVTELHKTWRNYRTWRNHRCNMTELHKTWRNYTAWRNCRERDGITDVHTVTELETKRDGITQCDGITESVTELHKTWRNYTAWRIYMQRAWRNYIKRYKIKLQSVTELDSSWRNYSLSVTEL